MSEEKLDLILGTVKEHRSESREMHEKLESRIRKVEETQAQQKGAFRLMTILGLPGVAGLSTFISKIIG